MPGVPGAASACTPVRSEGRLRRLTRVELDNTWRDLFADDSRPADALELEPQVGSFYNSAADLWADKPFLDRYVPLAHAVAARAAAKIKTLHPCAYEGSAEASCIDGFVTRFGERLFRQPVSAERARKLTGLFASLRMGNTFEESAQGLIAAMLLLPEFLYRGEHLIGAQAEPGDVGTRAQYQLAAQLAYLVTASTPDDELLGAARTGALRTREQVAAQARRLLGKAPGRAGLVQFAEQLFELPKYEQMDKDSKAHPEWSAELVLDMKAELRSFVGNSVFGADPAEATLSHLITSPTSFVTSRLARVYGLPTTGVDPAKKTTLPAGQRAGLLTQPGFLAHTSPKVGTKPVHRGHFVLKTLLCADLTPPPDAQQTLGQGMATAESTTRQRFELHTSRPECAACHLLIDPIGFGLENYDAIGRWRTKDGTREVDAKGVLVGTGAHDGPFTGGVELAGRLAKSEKLHGCFVTQYFRFAMGRKETDADACVLAQLKARFTAAKLDLRELVVDTISSDAFLERTRAVRR
jgi:hypothetical protein